VRASRRCASEALRCFQCGALGQKSSTEATEFHRRDVPAGITSATDSKSGPAVEFTSPWYCRRFSTSRHRRVDRTSLRPQPFRDASYTLGQFRSHQPQPTNRTCASERRYGCCTHWLPSAIQPWLTYAPRLKPEIELTNSEFEAELGQIH
jgi:hypothetical protein